MARRRIHIVLVIGLFLFTGRVLTAQECSSCDCYHFPIPKKCEKCCGFTSGKIASVTNSSIVISEKESASDSVTVKKTLALTPDTTKNAVLKEGAQATVYYRKEGNVATKVDLVEGLNGLLVPADEPDPPLPSSCSRLHPVPPDALRIYLGGNAAFTTSDEITVLNVRGLDVLGLRRTAKGLAINAKTFSEDGKVIAEIVDSRFFVNPNNFFRIERPDNHSILVYDLRGAKVIDIKFINFHSVRILGIFRIPGTVPLIVDEGQISVGGASFVGSCFSSRILFQF